MIKTEIMTRNEWGPSIYGRAIIILLFLSLIFMVAGIVEGERYWLALLVTVPALFFAILKSATDNHDNGFE